jgi:hypothetical protein
VLLTGLLALVGHPASAAPDDARLARLNEAIVREHVVPGHRAFAAATAELREAGAAFCRAPDATSLERARAAFHHAMDGWMRVQHIRFGPIELLSRAQRIQFWPDPRNIGARHLARTLGAGQPERLTPAAFPRQSVAVQGFPALERLLFEEAHVRALRSRGAEGRFACDLLQAIARNLADIAAGLLRGWSTGEGTSQSHLHWTTHPGRDNPYFHTAREVTQRLLTSLHGGLELIADRRLGAPLGQSLAQARPRLAESWRSGRSLRNVAGSLHALRDLVAGGGANALPGLLRELNEAKLATQLTAQLDAALEAAARIRPSLYDAVGDADAREDVVRLRARVNALRSLVATRLAVALDTPLGFNSLDGD